MDIDNNTEKLSILPEKIIHILLKHLMVLKNENAYQKNYIGIHLFDKGIGKVADGANEFSKGIGKVADGANQFSKGIGKVADGAIVPGKAVVKVDDGAIVPGKEAVKVDDGAKLPGKEAVKIDDGAKLPGKEAVKINLRENDNVSLYANFEHGLIEALEQYIKTADGQNTLYIYYDDFVDAVAEKNADEERMKDAQKNIRVEDTHILPAEILVDWTSRYKLELALREVLTTRSNADLYETIAHELLQMHNARNVTSAQLRDFSGLSVTGFRKHLTMLQRMGFIKKQPPSNYVLTDLSKHILLKTFGVPKG